MSRTKFTATAAILATTGLIGGITLAGPASAVEATGTINCVSHPYVTSTTVAPLRAHASGSSTAARLTMNTQLIANLDLTANTLFTEVKTSAGMFSATVNPEMYAGDPLLLGPLNAPTGSTVTSAALTTGTGTPSATNWNVHINIVGLPMDAYCLVSGVSNTLTW